MIKIVLLFIVVPIVLMMIFRTERKHVKFYYQLGEAKKALVELGKKNDKDKELQSPIFTPNNNFKLVTGKGYVTAKDPLKDDLFDLQFDKALRLYRRVEVLQEFKETRMPDEDDDSEIEGEGPIEVIRQRWIEVKNEGVPLELAISGQL